MLCDYKQYKDILKRGISQGRKEGLLEGDVNMCIRLIQKGLLKIEDAAQQLGMKTEELEKYL